MAVAHAQPCWHCRNYNGGCSWTARDPETGRLQFKPVDGWTAVFRVYGGRPDFGIKDLTSYDILACPEFVSDGTEHRRPALLPPDWEQDLEEDGDA